jgi:hypothetical protein
MSRKSGLDCSGDFKAAPDIRQNGPAAGVGYVLRAGPKVKVLGNRRKSEPVTLAGAFFEPPRRARLLIFSNYMRTAGFFGVLAAEARW